jgi:hypothetical protein
MAEQAYAYVTLIPVAKGFQKEIANQLDGVGGVGGDAGKKAGTGFKDSFSKVIKVGLGAAVAGAVGGAVIGKFMADVTTSASSLAAEFEGVNQVFGSAAKSVQDFAAQAAYSVGLTETAALQASKGFGVFASAAGLAGQDAASFATNLVQAAGDMASFNDVPVEEALDAIKSGLQGQGEPLAKYGILMNENTLKAAAMKAEIIESTDEALTPQQRVLAANALLFEELGVQQGDFVNYQDTFGNKLKTVTSLLSQMQTGIGEELLPEAERMLNIFEADIIPIFAEVAEDVGPLLASWMSSFADILEDAGDPSTFLGQAVIELKEAFSLLSEVLTPTNESIDGTSDSLGSLATLISFVTVTLSSLIAFFDTIGPAFQKLMEGDFAAFLSWLESDPIEWRRLNMEVNYTETGDIPNFGPMTGTGGTLEFLQGMGMGGVSQGPLITGGGGGGGGGGENLQDAARQAIKDARAGIRTARSEYRAAVREARANYRVVTAEIEESYQSAIADATTTRDANLAEALKSHTLRLADINKDFAKRQEDIITQSMDRLRDAYKGAVEINVASIFNSDVVAGSIDGTIEMMRKRLLDARQLVANAAALQAAGFSQTFIEQVVAAGPELGNELATSILNSSPEQKAEMRSLFDSIETEASHGMDSLAETLYEKNGLATEELRNLYAQNQVDLANALADQEALYAEEMTNILAIFDESVLAAKETRDDALADAKKDLTNALADANKQFVDDITQIEKTFEDKISGMRGQVGSLASQIANLETQLSNLLTGANANTGTSAPNVALAKGGLVTKPTTALIGEAGPEVVIPLDRFESMMSMMSMNQPGGALNYYAAPNTSLDSEQELFTAMKRAKVVVGW